MKTRILQYALIEQSSVEVDEVMKVLEPDYGHERMFSRKQVEEYLDSFLGVGFMDAADVKLNEEGSLITTYAVTEYGKKRGRSLGN
jgi:hypothetical protein